MHYTNNIPLLQQLIAGTPVDFKNFTFFMEHIDLLPENKIVKLVDIVINTASQCSGKYSESHELHLAKKVLHHPNYEYIKPYIAQYIDQMPAKNSNQIVQRALIADIFGVNLQSPSFDKISTKLSLPYKGWMLQRAIRLADQHHIDVLQYWIAERIVKTCTKNTVEDNLWAFRTVVNAPLSNTQLKGILTHLNTWFSEYGENLSVQDVHYIHSGITTLLDGKEYASMYKGIPCKYYQVAAEQWPPELHKYAATQFLEAYLQQNQYQLPTNAIIPTILIEHNAFLADVLAQDDLNICLLEKNFHYLNDFDTYLLDKMDLSTQFLFATARLFDAPINNMYYGIISPVVVKCLHKICAFFQINADTFIDQYLEYYIATQQKQFSTEDSKKFAPQLVLSFVKQALGQEDFDKYTLWMNTIYPDHNNFFIPAPYNHNYTYNANTGVIEELMYDQRPKNLPNNKALLPVVRELLQDKAQKMYSPEEIDMYFG